jgi:hypothetical protein
MRQLGRQSDRLSNVGKIFLHEIQTGPEAQRASYSMGTGG